MHQDNEGYTYTPGPNRAVVTIAVVVVSVVLFACAFTVLGVTNRLQPEHINAIVYGGLGLTGAGIMAAVVAPMLYGMKRAVTHAASTQSEVQARLVDDQSENSIRALNASVLMMALRTGLNPEQVATAVQQFDRHPDPITVGQGRTIDDRDFRVRRAALTIMAKMAAEPGWRPTQRACMAITGEASHQVITNALDYIAHNQRLVGVGKRGATRQRADAPYPTVIDNDPSAGPLGG